MYTGSQNTLNSQRKEVLAITSTLIYETFLVINFLQNWFSGKICPSEIAITGGEQFLPSTVRDSPMFSLSLQEIE